MKTRLLVLLTFVAACTAGGGLKPAAKNQFGLLVAPVFLSDDARVWQLTIETPEPAKYRLVLGGNWGGGEISGDTVTARRGRRGCEAKVWLVVSHIAPASGEHAYVKTILQGGGGTVTQTREVPKGSELGGIVSETTLAGPHVHSMNTPVEIARLDGQVIRIEFLQL